MQTLLLVLALVAGLLLAYMDGIPNWDDTAILVFGILLISGLITLLGQRRPWLVALAVGLWIPLHNILVTQNYGSILALAFALVGAYAGWAIRLGIQKTLHPA